MKRTLGRLFARVSGVLKRVWRWCFPAHAANTEVQLTPPRPDEPKPTVTREVIDLEFEEIRAALAAEPSVNAAAPSKVQLRPIDKLKFGDPPGVRGRVEAAPERAKVGVPVVESPVVEATRVDVVAPVETTRADVPLPPPPVELAQPEEPVASEPYRAPKYGRDVSREAKKKSKLAAPRPTPAAPPVVAKTDEPAPLAEPNKPLEDKAVADLIARVDMFMNMGDVPAPMVSAPAVTPELLTEGPTVREQIVAQMIAERLSEPEETPAVDAPEAPADEPVAAVEMAPEEVPPLDEPTVARTEEPVVTVAEIAPEETLATAPEAELAQATQDDDDVSAVPVASADVDEAPRSDTADWPSAVTDAATSGESSLTASMRRDDDEVGEAEATTAQAYVESPAQEDRVETEHALTAPVRRDDDEVGEAEATTADAHVESRAQGGLVETEHAVAEPVWGADVESPRADAIESPRSDTADWPSAVTDAATSGESSLTASMRRDDDELESRRGEVAEAEATTAQAYVEPPAQEDRVETEHALTAPVRSADIESPRSDVEGSVETAGDGSGGATSEAIQEESRADVAFVTSDADDADLWASAAADATPTQDDEASFTASMRRDEGESPESAVDASPRPATDELPREELTDAESTVALAPFEAEQAEPAIEPTSIEASPEALAVDSVEAPVIDDAVVEEPVEPAHWDYTPVVEAAAEEPPVEETVEPSVDAVMAAEDAWQAPDAPMTVEETASSEAAEESSLVAEASEGPVGEVAASAVQVTSGEAVTSPEDFAVEPVALETVLQAADDEQQREEALAAETAAGMAALEDAVASDAAEVEAEADVEVEAAHATGDAEAPTITDDAPATEEPLAAESIPEPPSLDEPLVEDDISEELVASTTETGDAEIDAELAAAMAQAEVANTAFATTHPEAAEEEAVALAPDDDERIEDEPWSPPPVMADPYYEYDMPPESAEANAETGEGAVEGATSDEPASDEQPAAVDERDARAAEELAVGDALPPEVVAMAGDEPLPPEVAAMAAEGEPGDPTDAEHDASLTDDEVLDAVAEAVEQTLAAADSFEAAAEAAADMPADADALAAAAMADVVASAEAAEEAPIAPPPPAFRNPIPKVDTPADYVATAESMHALYQLQLTGFEGPLDLLLHLIKRHHVDIFDIPIAFICERYLEYLKVMEDLDIDVASEFLFMASELLHLKSRMLLPRPEGETAEEEEVDPRAELVRRLLEYQKYKEVAERFGLLDRFGRDTFGREAEPAPPLEGEAPLKEVGLFALVKAFQGVLDRSKPEVRHQVMLEQVSVRQRIRVLVQRFEGQEPTRFDKLLEDAHRRIDIVVTFLALLEMGKLKLLRIFQDEDGVIFVHPKFDDVSLAFARLEGLDESQYAG